jgi:lysophospholipase L1-like esterase
VVFFGASLTWGANATDPNLTSYRGLVGRMLEREYPEAHFRFWDSAIGGTGSQLGAFRFDRDVLRHQPDLIFLDFSANDNINTDDRETLASYEALVRRAILEARAPVVQVILPFRWDITTGRTDGMKRRAAHLRIARAYNTAVGDAIELTLQRVQAGLVTPDSLWPVDGGHPCDLGYVVFADAVWSAFEEAVREGRVCTVPERMIHAPTYMSSARTRLSALGPPPVGWVVGRPNVVSAYFDHLMSRWLDDEVIASSPRGAAAAAGPWKLKFRGEALMLFGESTPKSGMYRVVIDGRRITPKFTAAGRPPDAFDASALGASLRGNTHHFQVLAEGLNSDAEHELVIEPVFSAGDGQELRLESVCAAGKGAFVSRGQ